MKTRMFLTASAALLALMYMSSAVWADTLPIKVGDKMSFYDYNHNNNAGVLNFYVNDISHTFDTFCAQQSVTISGGWHTVSAVTALDSNVAYKADYLYSQWANRTIILNSDAEETAFQNLIWDYLAGPNTARSGGFYDTLIAKAGNAVRGTFYGTYLISFADGSQQQLEDSTPVPEPASLLLLGFGLGFIGLASRRK